MIATAAPNLSIGPYVCDRFAPLMHKKVVYSFNVPLNVLRGCFQGKGIYLAIKYFS